MSKIDDALPYACSTTDAAAAKAVCGGGFPRPTEPILLLRPFPPSARGPNRLLLRPGADLCMPWVCMGDLKARSLAALKGWSPTPAWQQPA